MIVAVMALVTLGFTVMSTDAVQVELPWVRVQLYVVLVVGDTVMVGVVALLDQA